MLELIYMLYFTEIYIYNLNLFNPKQGNDTSTQGGTEC